MNPNTKAALLRAKALLGESADAEVTVMQAFEKLVSDARKYISENPDIASDVGIEIKLSKEDFEVSFERS